ncbi:membrane protein of unknown function [Petrocella atlantisensis]|uniref:Uncharacterized protein n=1 Tax=Petrocella atlantisensis TaxID=2173034 RepID=A0A3P7P202_9FIRM|nr:membrane protein of unknown function [Petrocella atlantisensis]
MFDYTKSKGNTIIYIIAPAFIAHYSFLLLNNFLSQLFIHFPDGSHLNFDSLLNVVFLTLYNLVPIIIILLLRRHSFKSVEGVIDKNLVFFLNGTILVLLSIMNIIAIPNFIYGIVTFSVIRVGDMVGSNFQLYFFISSLVITILRLGLSITLIYKSKFYKKNISGD